MEFDNLVVRRVKPDDIEALAEYLCSDQYSRYQFFDTLTRVQVEQLVEEQLNMELDVPGRPLILVAELDGRVIGDCQLTICDPFDRQAELGFAINPQYSGRGLASQYVLASIGFGFCQMELRRIVAGTDVRNTHSWRLLERIGMRREAHFVQDSFVKGELVDSYAYALLASEWQARHGKSFFEKMQ